jgi:hypothetical protein
MSKEEEVARKRPVEGENGQTSSRWHTFFTSNPRVLESVLLRLSATISGLRRRVLPLAKSSDSTLRFCNLIGLFLG